MRALSLSSFSACVSRDYDGSANWIPVLCVLGCLAFYNLNFEIGLFPILFVLILALWLRIRFRAHLGTVMLSTALLATAVGAGVAWLHMPQAGGLKRGDVATLTATIQSVEMLGQRRARVTFPTQGTRARVTIPATPRVSVGDSVELRVSLRPLPLPARPGGFDFARLSYLDDIQFTGFALARPKVIKRHDEPPYSLLGLIGGWLGDLRMAASARIDTKLAAPNASLAAALTVGNRADLDADTTAILRASGLYHIVSISGLHMMLVAAGVMALARLVFAAIPALGLRFSSKKLAAVVALLAVTAYLAISGAALTAIRAYIMVAVACAAILLDRPALSLRNVAIALLIIVLFRPASVLEAGFQMSFLATAALISAHEVGAFRPPARLERALGAVPTGRHIGTWLYVAALTSLVAGAATAPLAAYHFNQSANYALLGNLLGGPITALIVMPGAMLSLCAIPFGFEGLPLAVTDFGLTMLRDVARWVAGLPGAMSAVSQMRDVSIVLIVFGLVWLIVWRQPWRYAGVTCIAAGLALPSAPRPDILVDGEAQVVAVRQPDGAFSTPVGRRGAYGVTQWLAADGDARLAPAAMKGTGWICDETACLTNIHGQRVSLILHPSAQRDDCQKADIVIVRVEEMIACPRAGLVLQLNALRTSGAHAIYLTPKPEIDTVAAHRGDRRWVRSGGKTMENIE